MKLGITGDTHGDLTFKRFFQARKLGYTHIIVCGDFGYIWNGSRSEQKQLDYLSKIGITIMFCDGNHENHILLNEYPVDNLYGGKVHKIRNNIFHLIRGEIYTIKDKTFFVFGGANSTDKEWRIEGKTWWKEECPSLKEFDYALENLQNHNYKVDYIITHTCYPVALSFVGGDYRADNVSDMLNEIRVKTDFNYWYFGHMHLDYRMIDYNTKCIYRDIEELRL